MIKLGKISLGGAPRIAVGFKDNLTPQTLRSISSQGVDIVELRIDRYSSFDPTHVLSEVKKFQSFPTIGTIRSRKEGGGWHLSETKRLALFKAIIPHVDAVDIELSSKKILKAVVSYAHRAKKITIVSYHDFERTPLQKNLNRVLREAKAAGADIVKIAVMTRTQKDLQRMADFTLSNASKNIITISMGVKGALSRVLFPSLGSLLTYASMGEVTAPGQLDFQTTRDVLKKFHRA